MNSTFNTTVYTCSTESKRISEKAFKLCSFLQCSADIFLGHDGYLWKINLRILWNNAMKNFQVRYGQCDSIIYFEIFSLASYKKL